MVLESLLSPLKAEAHPSIALIMGAGYATLGLGLSAWIFINDNPSLMMVFLTTMAAIPLIYNLIKIEEKKDLKNLDEKNLLKEHSRALLVFLNYFVGVTLAFAFLYVIIPILFPNFRSSDLFQVQINTITAIRSNVTGNAYSSLGVFTKILSNNLRVLIFCVFFSFLFGVGAIFILTWNASVIGVAIGDTIRSGLLGLGKQFHIALSPSYAHITSCGLFQYAIHGIPEIGAYFIAGLGSGIISVAAIRHDFGTKKYVSIIMDSSLLLLLSLIILVIAAFLEVYVTPGLVGIFC